MSANDLAARFGGGGHPQAAGFHLPLTAGPADLFAGIPA